MSYASNFQFINLENISGPFESEAISPAHSNYSIQLVFDSNITYDLEMQVSLDKENWVTIDSTVLTDHQDASVIYNNSDGKHRYIKIVGEIKSGLTSVKGYIA